MVTPVWGVYVPDVLALRVQQQPDSPYSDFIDLENSQKLTSTQLFNFVYTGEHHVTFQTCIAKGSNLTWGRLFVIATPLDEF